MWAMYSASISALQGMQPPQFKKCASACAYDLLVFAEYEAAFNSVTVWTIALCFVGIRLPFVWWVEISKSNYTLLLQNSRKGATIAHERQHPAEGFDAVL
jgi:hypothetical protein